MKTGTPAERVSIFAVAKRAGCSIATVSNVLNDKGRVGPQKRKEVLRAIQQLNYQVSAVGRNLRMRKSEMLGLLFYPTCAQIFKNPFYAEIMEGLEEELTLKRYHLLLAGYQLSVTGDLPIPHFILQGKVDGMILLGRLPATIIQTFSQASSSPLLLLDSNVEWPIDSVISDGFSAEINVVSHLASRGHRNIIMLAYAMEDYNIDLRIQGFLAGLAQCGLPSGPENVIRHLVSHDDIYPALRERMSSSSPPTAIAAVNDTLAMAMITRLHADGFQVPRDLSVVGYDDDNILVDNRPFLSTIRVNKKELGRVGADLILKRIATPQTPVVKLRLPVEFIPRESIASIDGAT
jgi:DNA-binding LacI/PurR family transcriptional regulator